MEIYTSEEGQRIFKYDLNDFLVRREKEVSTLVHWKTRKFIMREYLLIESSAIGETITEFLTLGFLWVIVINMINLIFNIYFYQVLLGMLGFMCLLSTIGVVLSINSHWFREMKFHKKLVLKRLRKRYINQLEM